MMLAILIGIMSGMLIILSIALLKNMHKPTVYGLILAGIGFLYVGFTWADEQSLILNAAQAVFFLMLAYFGIIKNIYYLIVGYFLHGSWDLVYDLFPKSKLIPPHYDLFCLSVDFTIGFYLLYRSVRNSRHEKYGYKEDLLASMSEDKTAIIKIQCPLI